MGTNKLYQFCGIFIACICVCSTYANTKAMQSRIFSNGLRDRGGIVFSETKCSKARSDAAVHAVLNYLRYNKNREIREARTQQFWTEGSWPQVPPLDYSIDGVKIGGMNIQTFHFSVRHPDVMHELSMFLITFLSGNDFKLALYFNENIGRVGFTFDEATACNLRFRLISEWPYLNKEETNKQKEVLSRMWQEEKQSSIRTSTTSPNGKINEKKVATGDNLSTNDIDVVVDGL